MSDVITARRNEKKFSDGGGESLVVYNKMSATVVVRLSKFFDLNGLKRSKILNIYTIG